jgi:hypothetical protein
MVDFVGRSGSREELSGEEKRKRTDLQIHGVRLM